MKNLVNKAIINLHFIILAYGLYGAYTRYEEHVFQVEEITKQFPPIDEEIQANEKKIKEIQDYLKKSDEYKVRVDEVAKNIEAVQKQLPAETNDSQILTYFNQEMSVLNIKEPSLVPGKEEKSAYYISKEYALKAKGTFLQFLIFFERLSNAERIYNVKSLSLKMNKDVQKGRFQIIEGEGLIQAYRFNPEFKVDRGFEKIEGEFPVQ